MKLYYAPGACSLGIHVILEEIGEPYEAHEINLRAGEQFAPEYRAINPKAQVPVLVLDDGSILTEWLAIAPYIAERVPDAGLWPTGGLKRARAMEAMAYINTYMHGHGFRRMFRPERFTPDPALIEAVRAEGRRIFADGFVLMAEMLGDRDYLFGEFSVPDAALFYVSFWAEGRKTLPLPPAIAAHYARMLARPAVKRAMAAEGLV